MSEAPEPLVLAGDFDEASREQWLALVEAVLARSGAAPGEGFPEAFDRRLVSRTSDGLAIQPLYTAEDWAESGDAERWATRGLHRRTGDNRWEVRQRVEAGDDPAAAAASARAELAGGATSVLLDLRAAPRLDAEALRSALDGVGDEIPVALEPGERFPEVAEAMEALWSRAGGTLGADPLGEQASRGGADEDSASLAAASSWARRYSQGRPAARAFLVDASRYHEAGASEAQELGAALATGVAYLRAMEEAGMALSDSCAQIELRLAADADQFLTMAKLRAARQAWARMAEVAGAPGAAGALRVHAVTSNAMMTRYDPWVNLLRGTIACFAAGVGGAQAITVAPFDALSTQGGSELGRRLARNTQAILLEECGLARVIDPGGGSWFVERLTDELARAAWSCFGELERRGGMAAVLEAGWVQAQIAVTREARSARLARRMEVLTGVTEFADLEEEPPPTLDRPAPLEPGALPRWRWAEAFEDQRERADRLSEATGQRPTVFLANLGPPTAHAARADFARNLFAAAGIVTRSGPGANSAEELAAEFAGSGASLACLCSNEELYAELAAPGARALKAAGARGVYLAGRPGERAGEFREAGVDEFVFAGGDALGLLTRALDALEAHPLRIWAQKLPPVAESAPRSGDHGAGREVGR